ncbi:MAG: DNA polymerase III subunit beta [Lachnospiraceae bacterium]|nr:DNA polymerase III subunit beta [Lachnospiraceae bacterium]
MKIICQKDKLVNAVNIVLKAVPVKTTMPILESIVIEAIDGCIKLVSNDMEMAIETVVGGRIEEEGQIAINAKTFSDIVRKLPDSDVVIDTDEKNQLSITSENTFINIPGKSSEEFPALPEYQKTDNITLSQFTLREVINQTTFAISTSDSNKLMTGVYFEIKQNNLRVVALDGHRIAVRQVELKESYKDKGVIIPGKALNEISKILTGDADSEVTIYLDNMHAIFAIDDTIVLSRLIDGEYFNINQMLNNDYKTKVVINRKALYNSIDRVSPLYKETEKRPIVINIEGDNFELSLTSSIGNIKDNINIISEGEGIRIGFNPRFIMDVLKAVDDEEIFMYMSSPKSPCYIKDTENRYNYVILPVTLI